MTISNIVSPNNWLTKAGATVENGKIILPLNCLLVPMALASEAIIDFRKATTLNDRIKHGLVVVTMVRIADTAYFTRVANMLYEGNNKKYQICQHCIRGSLWPTKMKEYRKMVNQVIIHKMENGLPVNNRDLEIVEKYYEEMFKHPLMNPIKWDNATLAMCPNDFKARPLSSGTRS
jgi:hypothetical protein